MSTSQSLVDLLTTTVTLRRMARDSLGNASVASSQSVSVHVEYVRKQTFDRSGEKVIASAVAFFDDTITFDWEDASNEWEIHGLSQVFRVVSVEAIIDPRSGSLHHWEMLCV